MKKVGEKLDEVKFVKVENAGTSLMIDSVLVKWVRVYNIDKPSHTKEIIFLYVLGEGKKSERNEA